MPIGVSWPLAADAQQQPTLPVIGLAAAYVAVVHYVVHYVVRSDMSCITSLQFLEAPGLVVASKLLGTKSVAARDSP